MEYVDATRTAYQHVDGATEIRDNRESAIYLAIAAQRGVQNQQRAFAQGGPWLKMPEGPLRLQEVSNLQVLMMCERVKDELQAQVQRQQRSGVGAADARAAQAWEEFATIMAG